MNDTSGVAPEVASILEAARQRGGGDERLSVTARSLPAAFERARQAGNVPILAEVKPTSPTTAGERREDPVELAEAMVEGGAAALSVLTEPDHFGGTPENLRRVREAVDVPVLRKDFILREDQLDTVEADVVLLIVRFVEDLEGMLTAARERGFQVLVETHTAEEVETALDAGATLIGVNNRDLTQLSVDLETFEAVAPMVPDDVTLIAESGISSPADVRRMREAGADALLVGSAIMDGDVYENTHRLAGATGDTADTDSRHHVREESSMSTGKFGEYGGQYVPEALMPAIEELTDAYERYVLDNEDSFMDDFHHRMADFGGRPTPLGRADQLSDRYGKDVYLKREDLVHGGAHKLNNALGQVLLAKYMGKERIIAETGAGQHGTATAMAAAHLGMPCEIYMGETDIARQRPNVFRMRINGATVNPVTTGRGTLKEAISETMRDWSRTVENTHYVIGSVVGPHPFPAMVRDFQAVISEEAREQIRDRHGGLPDAVLACAGGGSNTMGAFREFVDDEAVSLYAVEAGGSSLDVDEAAGVAPNSASLSTGGEGILHGARTRVLQDSDGQIMESHSVSAGLDYAGVGPELAHLVDSGRVQAVNVGDDSALEAFHRLSQDEGIIPALESAHALGYLEEHHDELGECIVVNLSGRGDKDLETVIEETSNRNLEFAPDMDVFRDVGGGAL